MKHCRECYGLKHRRPKTGCRTCGLPWGPDVQAFEPPALKSVAGELLAPEHHEPCSIAPLNRTPVRDRVIELLSDGRPRTANDLRARVGTSLPRLRETLRSLVADGAIEASERRHSVHNGGLSRMSAAYTVYWML